MSVHASSHGSSGCDETLTRVPAGSAGRIGMLSGARGSPIDRSRRHQQWCCDKPCSGHSRQLARAGGYIATTDMKVEQQDVRHQTADGSASGGFDFECAAAMPMLSGAWR